MDRRISECIKDHNGRDLKSYILRHSIESGHANVNCEDFKIIAKNFNNSWKGKIAESLLIKEKRPSLNTRKIGTFEIIYLLTNNLHMGLIVIILSFLQVRTCSNSIIKKL